MTITARRHLIRFTALLALFAAAHLLDQQAFHALRVADRPALEESDWYQLLRSLGFLPAWIFLSLTVLLHASRPASRVASDGWWRPGVYLAAAPAVSGAMGELIKHLVGRERPTHNEGLYHFKPFLHAFTDGTNLGLPSTHACVAFAGAFAACFLYPRATPVFLAVACGCATTRLLTGAHFLTDVCAGAAVAYAVAAALRPPPPLGAPRP